MSFDRPLAEKKFLLLKPVRTAPRLDKIRICPPITDYPSLSPILLSILHDRNPLEPLALDFETRGLPLEEGSVPVGVGLADSRGSWYIDLQTSHPRTYSWLIEELCRLRIPLLAHNVNFDGMWMVRDFGLWPNWLACTYATYRLCATEGWPGQKWGLKDAQVELLGWKDSNEHELDQWLVDNKYGEQIVDGKTGKIKLRPDKAEMWRAPTEILGKYCALDADSTYQLYTRVLEPVLERFKALRIYATEMYPTYSRILIEQTLTGIKIDRERLEKHAKDNSQQLVQAIDAIYQQPSLRKWFDKFNQDAILEIASTEPPRHKMQRVRPPEPSMYTKGGEVSKSWKKWVANKHLYDPIISLNWVKWQDKYKATLAIKEHFNFNSYVQKKKLFYEYLYPTSHLDVLTRTVKDREIKENVFSLITDERQVYLPLTKSDGIPVDRKALRQMGDVGRVFLEYNDLVKEQQFIEALLENSQTGRLYPQFRVPGTLSGRLSGGGVKRKKPDGTWAKGLNIQQIPKSPGFLRCFVPDDGWVFVDCDISALEQVVLAELSKDPTLWKLYGPGSKPTDVYLHNGSNLPIIGPKIRASGFDPENPTREAVENARIKCKKERMLAKLVTLGASYKMGPAKLQRTLELENIKVSFDEAREIHRGYWDLYAGVKKYEYALVDQYEDNYGWVLNGIGRPLGIFESYKSDIINRVVQSTGHDLQVKYVILLEQVLKENNIPFRWVIADFHDQSIVQVPKEYADKVKELMRDACYERLNRWAGGQIPLVGDAQIVRDLSYAKVSKEDIKQYLKDMGIVEDEDNE